MNTIDGVLAELATVKSEAPNTLISILAEEKEKTVKFSYVTGTRPGALKSGISLDEGVAFIQQVTGRKGLLRQRATGTRSGFTEHNVQDCYIKVIANIVLQKGWSAERARSEFIKFVSEDVGEIKKFDSAALTEVFGVIGNKRKTEAAKDVRGRIRLLEILYSAPVPQKIRKIIIDLGYDVEEFINDAKNHHFVHYTKRGSGPAGSYVLHKYSGSESFNKIKNAKATRDLVAQNIITFDPSKPHIVTNETLPAKKEAKGDYVMSHTGTRERAEDEVLKADRAYLLANGFTEANLPPSGVKTKEFAKILRTKEAAVAV